MYRGKTLHRSLLSAGILLLIAAAILVAGCTSKVQKVKSAPDISTSPGGNRPTNGLTQSNDGGAVTVDVEWLGENSGNLQLRVTMNTHSVDLDGYDLGKLALLRDDKGNQYLPVSWSSQPGGHHREGVLTFQSPDADFQFLDLIIQNTAGVDERAFRWEFGAS